MSGFKVAIEVGEPYAIGSGTNGLFNTTSKTDTPRVESELSYATTFNGGSVHGWLEGLFQNATLANDRSNTSLGIAPGVNVQVGPVGVMASGYYGKALGMISAQDGATFGTDSATDFFGNDRIAWGFLGQATYQLTSSVRLAANYGANHENRTDAEASSGTGLGVKKCQEAGVFQVNYMLNKFTQFTLEGIWAQDTYQNDDKIRSIQGALGTVFFW
jgi:hypothetical protein